MEIDGALTEVHTSPLVSEETLERDFDQLFAANGAALARLASSYTNSASDRDDLLQDIALAVWRALRRFRGECSERTFLFRIAHNRGVAFLARTRSRVLDPSADLEVVDPAPDPESGLAAEQRVERLQRAIRRLPVSHRQVVTLTLEGLGYGEIATVLGISETNVGARLTRARQRLREILEERK